MKNIENQVEILDIMPYANIAFNYTNYIFLLLCVLVFIVTLIYLLNKIPQKIEKKEETIYEKSLKNLRNLDIENQDAKTVLYEFTKNAKQCSNEYNEKKLEIILTQIEELKYQNKSIVLDRKTKEMLKGYIQDELY